MSKRHRSRTYSRRAARAVDRQPAVTASAGGWNWRTGTAATFDGEKIRDSLRAAYASGYNLDYATIRAHARRARWDSAYARAILRRLTDTVIGTGMSASAAPVWDIIKSQMSPDQQAKLSREITQQYHLYMQSHEPDATGRMTGYELQAFEFLNELGDGEAVIVQRFSGERSRMSPVNLQFIDPDQVSTPFDKIQHETSPDPAGHHFADGIEVDAYGREVAFHVQDPLSTTPKWTRIPTAGPSGRRFVLHPGNFELVGQARGVSVLAPIVHDLLMITDYSLYELQAAAINALIVGYEIAGDGGRTSGFGGGIKKAAAAASTEGAASTQPFRTAKIDKGGVWISRVPKGGDIKSFDTKRPNVNFEVFVRAVVRALSAALGIPIEVLEESFNANYSASRASLILFWQRVESWRESLISQFLQPWYDTWFTEAVRAGRFEAPGFTGGDPIVRAAWLNVNWIGVSMPSIDPLKDAQADDARIKQGATTREQVAMKYNGSSYEENARQLKRENVLLKDAGFASESAPAPDASKPSGDAVYPDGNGGFVDENGDEVGGGERG